MDPVSCFFSYTTCIYQILCNMLLPYPISCAYMFYKPWHLHANFLVSLLNWNLFVGLCTRFKNFDAYIYAVIILMLFYYITLYNCHSLWYSAIIIVSWVTERVKKEVVSLPESPENVLPYVSEISKTTTRFGHLLE